MKIVSYLFVLFSIFSFTNKTLALEEDSTSDAMVTLSGVISNEKPLESKDKSNTVYVFILSKPIAVKKTEKDGPVTTVEKVQLTLPNCIKQKDFENKLLTVYGDLEFYPAIGKQPDRVCLGIRDLQIEPLVTKERSKGRVIIYSTGYASKPTKDGEMDEALADELYVIGKIQPSAESNHIQLKEDTKGKEFVYTLVDGDRIKYLYGMTDVELWRECQQFFGVK